jgi:hypothetical protein
MELHEASIPTIVDILLLQLPPDERKEFKNWAGEVSKKDFWGVLPSYFSDDEVKDAIAQYATEQIEQLEHFCGIGIHALIKVNGRTYVHGSFNDEYGC